MSIMRLAESFGTPGGQIHETARPLLRYKQISETRKDKPDISRLL